MQASSLTIKIVEARGLEATDRGGTSDPYVRVRASLLDKPVQLKGKPQKKTLAPKWNLSLTVPGVRRKDIEQGRFAACPVVVDVYDWNLVHRDEFLGRAQVDVADVLKGAQTSYSELWVPLRGRSDAENKKEKVAVKRDDFPGEVRVLLILDDPNIPEEELVRYQASVALATGKIREMHAEYRKRAGGGEVRTVSELVEIFRRTGVLEACVTKWNGSSTVVQSPQFDVLMRDEQVMQLVFQTFFDAFDSDRSGTINFEEMLVGMDMLLNGSREEVCRMHFQARDKNGDGVLTKDEARHLAQMTIALIKAAFMLGIRTQKLELMKLGLTESDFEPICDAVTGAFEVHDVATIEVDLMFRYADKDKDGVVSQDEYVQWSLNADEMALRNAELQQLLEPCMKTLKLNVQVAMTQLLQRVMR